MIRCMGRMVQGEIKSPEQFYQISRKNTVINSNLFSFYFQVDLEPEGKVHIVIELNGSSSDGNFNLPLFYVPRAS